MTPAVFVHGFLGGSRQWDGQVRTLGPSRVVTVDLPGFGENAALDALPSIAANADWVLDALARRGIDHFHLIGHSMGGMITQEMAIRAPGRLDSLILYGTGATGILPGRFETIGTSKRRAQADGAEATARRIAATWFLKETRAAAYPACATIAAKAGLPSIFAGLDAMEDWSGTDRLADIRTRTLVLWGDHDRTYPWSQPELLWRTIPGASLAVIPDTAHASHLEKPALFNAVVNDFIEAQEKVLVST